MELTGKWYIKRKLLGFKIIVEYSIKVECSSPDGLYLKKQYYLRQATELDLIELNINIY